MKLEIEVIDERFDRWLEALRHQKLAQGWGKEIAYGPCSKLVGELVDNIIDDYFIAQESYRTDRAISAHEREKHPKKAGIFN